MKYKCQSCNFKADDNVIVCPDCGGKIKRVPVRLKNILILLILFTILMIIFGIIEVIMISKNSENLKNWRKENISKENVIPLELSNSKRSKVLDKNNFVIKSSDSIRYDTAGATALDEMILDHAEPANSIESK
ncbi:MAG: hypothetical protein COA79_18155 [Planctomycetota bacterium]|nr:MAG: hypothetical protein COA79_18155 [Planctomycetota bacterium]